MGVRATRLPRRKVDGVLLLDKATGISSNHALQAARRVLQAEKAGHTGTLDPLASGLLPLCFGEATKFSAELLDADKEYLATVQLGVTTDTADAEGRTLESRPVSVTPEQVSSVLAAFRGVISQVPPMYSALKRDGKPLYEYARMGVELERQPRQVMIHDIHGVSFAELASNGQFQFSVRCSKGTYVRTLAADIGERLGCGAHLTALRRTAIGRLSIDEAVTFATFEGLLPGECDRLLHSPDFLLGDMEQVSLESAQSGRLRHGQSVSCPGAKGPRVKVYDDLGHFLGVCLVTKAGLLKPQRLVAE